MKDNISSNSKHPKDTKFLKKICIVILFAWLLACSCILLTKYLYAIELVGYQEPRWLSLGIDSPFRYLFYLAIPAIARISVFVWSVLTVLSFLLKIKKENSNASREEHKNSTFFKNLRKFITVVYIWFLACMFELLLTFADAIELMGYEQEPRWWYLGYDSPLDYILEWSNPTILNISIIAVIILVMLYIIQKRFVNPSVANNVNADPKNAEKKNQTIPSSQKSQKTKQAVHTNESPQRDFSDLFSGSVAGFLLCIPVIFFCFCINTLVGWVALVGLPIIVTKALFEDEHLMKEQEKEINRLRIQSAIMQFQNERQYGIKSTNSTPTIDTNRLRSDLMDYYGTAMHSGSPMAQADLVHVQRASDAELIREAQKSGFDLNKYTE